MNNTEHEEFILAIEDRLKSARKSAIEEVVAQAEEWAVRDPVFSFECHALAKAMLTGNTAAFLKYGNEYLGSCDRLEISVET